MGIKRKLQDLAMKPDWGFNQRSQVVTFNVAIPIVTRGYIEREHIADFCGCIRVGQTYSFAEMRIQHKQLFGLAVIDGRMVSCIIMSTLMHFHQ